MHNCSVKSHPHDRCPVCVEIPRLEAKVQESEAELAPIRARLAAIKARVKSPRREAISRAASRAACAVRTALSKVRLEASTRFRNMRGAALRATRLIVRDGLSIGGEALLEIGDAMVRVSDFITINDLVARREVPDNVDDMPLEPDNVDDEPLNAEPDNDDEIADAMDLLERVDAAIGAHSALRG